MDALITEGLPLIDNDAATAQAALETIGWSVMVLDGDAAVRYANPAARRELQGGHLFRLQQGTVSAARAEQAQGLRSALAQARQGKRCMLKMGAGPRGRMLSFVPLWPAQGMPDAGGFQAIRARGSPAARGERVLVIWVTDDQPLRSTLCLFALATGLTSSEREVLEELCLGHQPQAIASKRDVKLTTVRSQICSIRSKLGARSVHEVIAGALTTPPLSPRDFTYSSQPASAAVHPGTL